MPVAGWRLKVASLLLAGLVVLLDRLSKRWVDANIALGNSLEVMSVFSLTRAHNYGISLGLFQAGSDAGRWVLVAVTSAIAIGLFIWLLRGTNQVVAVAIGLILGGAVGNIWDRIVLGYVLDFAHVHVGGWSFYIFNVADAAITCGVVLMILDSLRPAQKTPN